MLFDSKGDNVNGDEIEEDESGTLISNGVELACKLKSMELVGVVFGKVVEKVEGNDDDDNTNGVVVWKELDLSVLVMGWWRLFIWRRYRFNLVKRVLDGSVRLPPVDWLVVDNVDDDDGDDDDWEADVDDVAAGFGRIEADLSVSAIVLLAADISELSSTRTLHGFVS